MVLAGTALHLTAMVPEAEVEASPAALVSVQAEWGAAAVARSAAGLPHA